MTIQLPCQLAKNIDRFNTIQTVIKNLIDEAKILKENILSDEDYLTAFSDDDKLNFESTSLDYDDASISINFKKIIGKPIKIKEEIIEEPFIVEQPLSE
jgi:hypothetical protein